MAFQKNVAQQNAETKAEIYRTTQLSSTNPILFEIAASVLELHGIRRESALLVHLSEIPEQEGNLFSGLWLTDSLQFWQFEVIVSRHSGELLGVDKFENVTPTIVLNAHTPGIGKSFGCLAHEVLSEIHRA